MCDCAGNPYEEGQRNINGTHEVKVKTEKKKE